MKDLHTIDIHSHLADHYFDDDREATLARMGEASVGTITIGVDAESSRGAAALAAAHSNVWACIGVHPESHNENGATFDEAEFEEILIGPERERIVAVGECGLDFFRCESKDDARAAQLPEFEKQIAFALKHDLPLMLHVRPSKGTHDAYDEVIDILSAHHREAGERLRGNAHFFAGSESQAKRFFDLGFTISFTGVITFADEYDEIVKMAPLSRLHAETDAPYVTPKPHRGKKNEPTYVIEVVKRIAQLRGEDVEEVQKTLRENARRVFGI